jgi:nucleoprotein TPR
MSAGKHADLIRKVESLSALTDSNRLLREEKLKLESIVNSCTQETEQARATVTNLELKVKELEEKVTNLNVEKTGLLTETENWKKRSDQLIEKSFKLNPDELRRLQEQNQKLTSMATTFKKEKMALVDKVNGMTKELTEAKQAATAAEQEAKKGQAELQEKLKENKSLITTQTTYKNAHQNMTRQNADLKKKIEELEKSKQETTNALTKLRYMSLLLWGL